MNILQEWLFKYFCCSVFVFIYIMINDVLYLQDKDTNEITNLNDAKWIWLKFYISLYWIIIIPYVLIKTLWEDYKNENY